MVSDPSPYSVLADILTSKKVGLIHVRLVGELVVAQADLNQWYLEVGKRSISTDSWVDVVEVVLGCERQYKEAWRGLVRAETKASRNVALRELEHGLRDAVTVVNRQLATFGLQ